MAFVTLGEALESALASALNVGEGSVGADPVSPKEAGTEGAPASLQEVVQTGVRTPVKTQPATKATSLGNAKRGRTHPKASEPPLGVRPRLVLVVDNSGRPALSGGTGRAAYRASAGRERARELVLVWDGEAQCMASTALR